MTDNITDTIIAARLWFLSWISFTAGALIFSIYNFNAETILIVLMCAICSAIGSLPALVILFFAVSITERYNTTSSKFTAIVLIQFSICLVYGLFAMILFGVNSSTKGLQVIGSVTGVLFACNISATLLSIKVLKKYFFPSYYIIEHEPASHEEDENNELHSNTYGNTLQEQPYSEIFYTSTNNTNMSQANFKNSDLPASNSESPSNKILIKGVITAGLILAMLIPTVFISNLVQEREQRQKQVVAEVSNKWANAQTITGPYIVVPYNEEHLDDKNKKVVIKKSLFILPENLNVDGNITPEKRLRSIYTVLLYRSNLNANGVFNIKLPNEINPASVIYNEAKVCIGINDFKGIEEKLSVNVNGTVYDLNPGLPSQEIDKTGLSSNINLTAADLNKNVAFNFNLKIKGSEQLSFVPLSGNSKFTLKSAWPNPSFDGNSLPTERQVNDKGFVASWSFNKANLPFNTILKEASIDKDAYSFGVTMLQPADQYAKTMRSVKYAILFIGLTFSLFFIVELMQKKPVHPVQYVLVGLALVIFYSLLLSISEFVLFDNAYLIASVATVSLITLYAKSHFESWKVAGIFALVLSLLYGFIFVLIRLEDTALLVGSIGLFTVLALVMYASRKINWYHPTLGNSNLETA